MPLLGDSVLRDTHESETEPLDEEEPVSPAVKYRGLPESED